MSEDYYYIPFEIQSEIMKRLPVKSLVQFRSVSKQWKSFIDWPEFIRKYHINRTNPKQHLLVRYNLGSVQTYTSIVDDITFPQQKFPITAPEPLNLLKRASMVGSVNGLLCLYGCYLDVFLKTKMAVIWNPSLRKCVGIPIPNVVDLQFAYTHIGFGVCPDTNDPKLVKINVVKYPSSYWEVQVFTLSSRIWKPFASYHLKRDHVSIDGIIYWGSYGCFIISFDFKSEKFGEVSIPEVLVHNHGISLVKVNDSLGLLEYNREVEMLVCGVWMRKDGLNKPFTKMYIVKVEGRWLSSVLGFRRNGEVVMEMEDDDFNRSPVEVYEPSSGRISNVGISGERRTFSAWSYMETLLLLDESNSIIH